MGKRKLACLLALIGLLVLLPAGGLGLSPLADDGALPRFEPAPCPVPAPDDVECGYLVVPEDRSDPNSRSIRLAVAVLKSHSDNPAPDPVVYLEGGPGGSAVDGLDHWLDTPIRDRRDLILFEQRGTQHSEPSLSCPKLREVYVEIWELNLDDEEAIAREVEASTACRDRLRAEGTNLAAYNSAANAADLADLRRALGFDEWNLYGISYGTRLALTAMRDQPQGIRSVILDSVYPPPLDAYVELAPFTARVVNKLLDDCAADPICKAAYPDLEVDLFRLLEQANEQPFEITAYHPETGEKLRLPLDGESLVAHLFIAFYDSALIPYLPLAIDQLSQGNTEVLLPMTDMTLDNYTSGSEGMNISVQCHEEAPFNSLEAVAAAAEDVPPLLVAYTITDTLAVCEIWGAGQAGPLEDEPVHSDIPTLVLEGDYDPITPPAAGQLAAETLSNSFYYQFPGLGHGTTLDDCPLEITLAFLDDPTVEPDASCLETMNGPAFYTSEDLYVTPAAYRLVMDLVDEDNELSQGIVAFLAMFFLLLVFVVLWAVLRLLRVWACPHPWLDGLFHALLAAIAVLNVLFAASLAGLVFGAMLSDWSILVFGLPKTAPLVLIIPLLAAFLTAVWIVLLAVGWIKGTWPLWRCGLYALFALGLLIFFWFLAYWDLLGVRL